MPENAAANAQAGLRLATEPGDASRDCRIITLPRINNSQGNLTFVEGGNHIPFDVRRVYYLYDVPAGAERGGQPIDSTAPSADYSSPRACGAS